MKVLLNSDITFPWGLDTLPQQVIALAEACRDRRHAIALPMTTVLEFERRQTDLMTEARKALQEAAAELDRFGIAHDEVKPQDRIRAHGLDELLRATGVTVEVVTPTLEDYNDAHRRACLHLSPEPPKDPGDKKEAQDEMRDLVIWSVCVRLAREQGGALLVSHDIWGRDFRHGAGNRAWRASSQRARGITGVTKEARPEQLTNLACAQVPDWRTFGLSSGFGADGAGSGRLSDGMLTLMWVNLFLETRSSYASRPQSRAPFPKSQGYGTAFTRSRTTVFPPGRPRP